jgi:hypothetical protein
LLTKSINKTLFESHEARSRSSADSTPGSLVNLVHERLGERRFYALADEVRRHRAEAERDGGVTPEDEALYARLRLICGEL